MAFVSIREKNNVKAETEGAIGLYRVGKDADGTVKLRLKVGIGASVLAKAKIAEDDKVDLLYDPEENLLMVKKDETGYKLGTAPIGTEISVVYRKGKGLPSFAEYGRNEMSIALDEKDKEMIDAKAGTIIYKLPDNVIFD